MNEVTVDGAVVHLGSCLDILPTLADNSVDSVVTDPPYELGFMGKAWDSSGIAFNVEVWRECLRVLKPGGHLLAFGGSRTWHRIAVAIEDAGFEIRDSIAWIYGQGFPKSMDISKQLDKMAGAEREVIGTNGGAPDLRDVGAKSKEAIGIDKLSFGQVSGAERTEILVTAPATDDAKKWAGWGTALKPAFEPVVVARKPLIGTVAANVLEWGTGAINIDGTRIGTQVQGYRTNGKENSVYGDLSGTAGERWEGSPNGRWPANVMLDEHTAQLLDEQADCSRFFYVAKASKRDRNEGLDELPEQRHADREKADGIGGDNPRNRSNKPRQNFHPTVKPTDLMRQLIRLVTPPGGTVLDPFTGSGSTGKAAILENFNFIGCELTEDYLPIIKGRLEHARQVKDSQIV